jgi:uncharacterized protein (DUF3084 family)
MGGNLHDSVTKSKQNLLASSEAISSAHLTFTTHFTSFLSVADQIEQRFKELEEREAKLGKREVDVTAKELALKDQEKKCLEREQKVEQREQDVTTQEHKWKETEKRMELNASKLPTVIQLNVGMDAKLLLFMMLFIYK